MSLIFCTIDQNMIQRVYAEINQWQNIPPQIANQNTDNIVYFDYTVSSFLSSLGCLSNLKIIALPDQNLNPNGTKAKSSRKKTENC